MSSRSNSVSDVPFILAWLRSEPAPAALKPNPLDFIPASKRDESDQRGSRLSAEQKLKARERGGVSPAEWEGEIELAKAKRERKSTGARHNRRGVAHLPVATAKELAEAAPRYCDICQAELSPDVRPDKKRCGKACDEAARNRLRRERKGKQ